MNVQLTDRPIDADNHYYEPLDAFTRYQDPKMKRRGVQIVRQGNRTYLVVADKINYFIPVPTFDPVIVPGCIDVFFRAQMPKGVDPQTLVKVEPIRPEYRDRDKRLERMDSQGLGAVLLFPTMGVGIEESLTQDPEATMAALSAFNRWLEEDWGFAYKNRIFSAPLLSLADPAAAEAEAKSLLKRGAKLVHIRPAPVPAAGGPRSLGDPAHDRVWSLFAEANVPVAFHTGDSGYLKYAAAWGGYGAFEPYQKKENPLDRLIVEDRAIRDTISSMIAHGVFHRHPKLRICSVENGSDWLAVSTKWLKKIANQMPSFFPDDPVDTLRNHLWVAPYYEDDLKALSELIGMERILFGSDFPHGEGLADPVSFTKELKGFPPTDIRKVMRDNAVDLLGFDPAA
jgi:predicted TIM-barrel fold metal-dependent hydrolase